MRRNDLVGPQPDGGKSADTPDRGSVVEVRVGLRVVLPPELPHLTPAAANALLKLLVGLRERLDRTE
ncbi:MULTISPECIES: hypothetical protein [Pseudonocardia]|nr:MULTISPECIES: hypothetical protein [Pseudonocardia]